MTPVIISGLHEAMLWVKLEITFCYIQIQTLFIVLQFGCKQNHSAMQCPRSYNSYVKKVVKCIVS